MRRVLISVGEASGDRLGAELVAALGGQVRVEGVLGPALLAAGAHPVAGSCPMPGAMGLGEVVRHLGVIRRNRAAVLAALDSRPDVYVTVDSYEFHAPLARAARARGIPVVGYVTPQVWAWRPGRARGVARTWTELLCLFPFEPALFTRWGGTATWVGHPVRDRVGPSAREPGVVAIFPGSRPAEVRRHLAVFLGAARRVSPRELLVAVADRLPADPTVHPLAPGVPLGTARLVTGAEALARAERALTKSGTTTLELAAAGVPFVVAHRVSWLTWMVGRALVRGVRHLALPNVLAGREVVPEFVQRFDEAQLAAALAGAPDAPVVDLGPPGAAGRAADRIRALLARLPAAS